MDLQSNVELRWLERPTGKRLMNEWGYYYDETVKELQWRVGSDCPWQTVPVVQES